MQDVLKFMKRALCRLEKPESDYPVTQSHAQEEQNSLLHYCKNLKTCTVILIWKLIRTIFTQKLKNCGLLIPTESSDMLSKLQILIQ